MDLGHQGFAEEEGSAAAPLTPLLHDSMVWWDVLNDRYRPLLRLVETVLGVIPTATAIWRSGRRRTAPTTSWCPTC